MKKIMLALFGLMLATCSGQIEYRDPTACTDVFTPEFCATITGAQGPAGEPGEDGTDGTDGVDGGGCIVIKLDNGAEVVCEDGTSVIVSNGTNGADGTDGTDGVDGADGADGQDGTDGTNGTDGQDGAQGPQGPAGQDGESCTVTCENKRDVTITCGMTVVKFKTSSCSNL